jgi:hypothetical protein
MAILPKKSEGECWGRTLKYKLESSTLKDEKLEG